MTDAGEAGESDAAAPRLISRRKLLFGGAATAAAAAVQPHIGLTQRIASLVDITINVPDLIGGLLGGNAATGGSLPTRTLTTWLRRREDFLRLRFDFYNLRQGTGSDTGYLTRVSANQPAFMAVSFPPQHIAEEAFSTTVDFDAFGKPTIHFQSPTPVPPVRTRLAGESRLVFEIPKTTTRIPYTTAGLLDWKLLAPRLVPAALSYGTLAVAPPPELVPPAEGTASKVPDTALEVPWRLMLSPLPGFGWAHRTGTGPAAAATELWHTRLGLLKPTSNPAGVRVDDSSQKYVRAVWNTDAKWKPTQMRPASDAADDDADDLNTFSPFRGALAPKDRVRIVQNSSAYAGSTAYKAARAVPATQPPRPPTDPRPVRVEQLMLSALGAWFNAETDWSENGGPVSVDLLYWRHRAVLGRDCYVEVINDGYLMPFGHRAVQFKISQRQVVDIGGAPTAVLTQREFFVTLQRERTFGGVPGQRQAGRKLPFKAVRVLTKVTPDVVTHARTGGLTEMRMGSPGNLFHYSLEGVDWEGNVVAFSMPLVYLLKGTGTGGGVTAALSSYNVILEDEFRFIDMGKQPLSFAKSAKPGDTTMPTASLIVGVEANEAGLPADSPRFFPVLRTADVALKAADTLGAGSVNTPRVYYPNTFLNEGFGADQAAHNPADVFLELVDPIDVLFGSTENSGGVISPSFPITVMSRTQGAIGGGKLTTTSDLGTGQFRPSSVFTAELDATLIGGIKLSDVIGTSTYTGGSGSSAAVALTTRKVAGGVETRMHWTPNLKDDASSRPVLTASRAGNPGSFVLDVTSTALDGQDAPVLDVRGELRDCTLNLLGKGDSGLHFIDIELRQVVFTSRSGSSNHVDVKLGEITFVGPLKFIDGLKDVLSSAGGGVGVRITPAAIEAFASLEVPSVQCGIFSLQNLAFGVTVGIPLDGTPVYVEFGISKRSDPFLLSFGIFGGGGWFALRLNSRGFERVEIGLEFGAVAAVSFGPVGGSVEMVGGFYFALEDVPGGHIITLAGFIRFSGELHVGFVQVGLDAELELKYVQKEKNNVTYTAVTGRAEVTLHVPMCPDISFSIERTFGEAPSDPTYCMQVSSADFNDHWGSFVPLSA